MAGDRARLRTTFEEAALLYDEARPCYPAELFDDVVSPSRIPAGEGYSRSGTGQATLPFASRLYPVFCIELGENLAFARKNLAGYHVAHSR